MKRIILAAALLAACSLTAAAQSALPPASQYPAGSTALSASSGTVAAGVATATLTSATDKTAFICGFAITSTGATAAAVVAPTITGPIGGTMTFAYATVAGATAPNTPLVVSFQPCVPASALGTNLVVSMPSLGSGNTQATINAWGYRK